jgi:hypothetical protein
VGRESNTEVSGIPATIQLAHPRIPEAEEVAMIQYDWRPMFTIPCDKCAGSGFDESGYLCAFCDGFGKRLIYAPKPRPKPWLAILIWVTLFALALLWMVR